LFKTGATDMKKILLLTLILFCVFSAFGQSKKTKKSTKQKVSTTQTPKKATLKGEDLALLTDEEYKVFLTILGNDRRDFVIRDKIEGTALGQYGIDNLKQTFEEINSDIAEDYVLRNKESAQIEKRFPTKNDYILITENELNKLFESRRDWAGFYKKYPKSGGIYTFSRVGFSPDGKQAVVSVGFGCGLRCGKGKFYLLQKEEGEWRITKEQVTWVS
jgi:hypothetical protein